MQLRQPKNVVKITQVFCSVWPCLSALRRSCKEIFSCPSSSEPTEQGAVVEEKERANGKRRKERGGRKAERRGTCWSDESLQQFLWVFQERRVIVGDPVNVVRPQSLYCVQHKLHSRSEGRWERAGGEEEGRIKGGEEGRTLGRRAETDQHLYLSFTCILTT